ncbi:MAG: protein kinase [Bacilli bacterium]|jgi:serine/threonine-protein kinase
MRPLGQVIDQRYRITAFLGAGGMAEVYEAKDIIMRRLVAVKIIKDDVLDNPQNVLRFEREARAAASLDHPNIVAVLNLGSDDGHPYMVNELINGVNLGAALETRTRFTHRETLDIINQLCSAVICAHENGVIHRDIKPANIYMTPAGIIKLGDFGIAQILASPKMTNSQDIIGSAHYLAPEVSQGKSASIQSDLYAIGITFFEIATGHLPYEAETNVAIAVKHIKEKFPSPRKYLPLFPKAMEKIMLKACKKNPRDRYKTVRDFQKEIQNLLANPNLLKPRQSFFVRFFGFATDE